jgi:hypothetical protein
MFREGSEHPTDHTADSHEETMTEIAPGVFDASSLIEQEMAKEDPIFAGTLAEIEKATDPTLRNLLEKIKNRMVDTYVGSKYKVDGQDEGPTYH